MRSNKRALKPQVDIGTKDLDGENHIHAKKERGRPALPPRVKADSRRGGRYNILGLGNPIKLETKDYINAIQALAAHLSAKSPIVNKNIESICVGDILKDQPNKNRYVTPHLVNFWSKYPISRINHKTCMSYVKYRSAMPGKKERVEDSTIVTELSVLQAVLNEYCKNNSISPVPKVYFPEFNRKQRKFLRSHEVKRLLLACEGFIWDNEKDGIAICEKTGQPKMLTQAQRAQVWPLTRVIILCIETGSRVGAVMEARWTKNASKSYIDLNIERFYRRGDKKKESTKRQTTVRMTKRLVSIATDWAEKDELINCDYVIHDLDGNHFSYYARAFAIVRSAAGFHKGVTLQMLRSSCAIWQMEGGATPEEAADFLGNTDGILSAFYDHYIPEFSFAAADALDSRAF